MSISWHQKYYDWSKLAYTKTKRKNEELEQIQYHGFNGFIFKSKFKQTEDRKIK